MKYGSYLTGWDISMITSAQIGHSLFKIHTVWGVLLKVTESRGNETKMKEKTAKGQEIHKTMQLQRRSNAVYL